MILLILNIYFLWESGISWNNNILWEGFKTNSNKTIILMGDSILKNNAYVSNENSVEQLVSDINKNTYCYAEDHAKISDIFSQISELSLDLNYPTTYIFLSAGGNDILSHYVDQQKDINNSTVLTSLYKSHKKLVESIQARLPLAKIVILDIYYPNNMQYKQYRSIIQQWNQKINQYSGKYDVLKISEYVTQPDDFMFGIEPSITGGKKIATLITQ